MHRADFRALVNQRETMNEWDSVRDKIKSLEKSFIKTHRAEKSNQETATVANFWKNRYEEEKKMWSQLLANKEKEQSDIREKVTKDADEIHSFGNKLTELEQRLHSEKQLWDELSKIKHLESSLEKKEIHWEEKLALLKQDSDSLKNKILKGELLTERETKQKKEIEVQRKKIEEENEILKQRIDDFTREEQKKIVDLDLEKKYLKKQLDELRSVQKDGKVKSDQLENELSLKIEERNSQLARLEEREKDHLRSFENMTAAFAHKIKNHLGITSGILQSCLQQFNIEQELKSQISFINQNSKDMFLTVEEFFQMAKLAEVNLKPIHLNSLIEDSLELLEKIAQNKKVKITRKLTDRLPYLKMDKVLMSEAISHILENAVASCSEGGTVTIQTIADEKAGTLQIIFSDTGHGIPERLLNRVTNLYFTTEKGKRGLGLTLAKRAVDLHQGTLSISSIEKEGTTVTFQFLLPKEPS